MVSVDDAEKNRAFAESVSAELVLLSDTTKTTARAYGVSTLGGLYNRRWTFYIEVDGRLRHIDKKVRVGSAGQDIARNLAELGFPQR
jgi:peroxiredoxin